VDTGRLDATSDEMVRASSPSSAHIVDVLDKLVASVIAGRRSRNRPGRARQAVLGQRHADLGDLVRGTRMDSPSPRNSYGTFWVCSSLMMAAESSKVRPV
jgi:hypothetical protein